MEHSSTPDIVHSAAAHAGGSANAGRPGSAKAPLAGGVMAGIGAAMCCIGPLVFAALGFGAAAAGLIALFTPLRPIFIGLALLFLGFAAYRLFYVLLGVRTGNGLRCPEDVAQPAMVIPRRVDRDHRAGGITVVRGLSSLVRTS